jgi:hypothetical protein
MSSREKINSMKRVYACMKTMEKHSLNNIRQQKYHMSQRRACRLPLLLLRCALQPLLRAKARSALAEKPRAAPAAACLALRCSALRWQRWQTGSSALPLRRAAAREKLPRLPRLSYVYISRLL